MLVLVMVIGVEVVVVVPGSMWYVRYCSIYASPPTSPNVDLEEIAINIEVDKKYPKIRSVIVNEPVTVICDIVAEVIYPIVISTEDPLSPKIIALENTPAIAYVIR